MWPFDLLRRLFGKPADDDPVGDKLAEFVNREQGRDEPQSVEREKTGSREMIAIAKRTVDTIASAYETYVREKVLKRFGKDFKLYKPADAQTRDMDLRFGDTKTGNEYRYCALAFKDRFAIVLRVQAMILSRDLQVKTLYFELKSSAPAHVQELDFSDFPSLAEVAWDKVFDRVVLDFLEWHKALTKGN